MRSFKLFRIIFIVLLISSCNHHAYINPFDPQCEAEDWGPENIQVRILSDSEVELSWENETTLSDGFDIFRKMGDAEFEILAHVDSSCHSFVDTGLTVGVVYQYQIFSRADENICGDDTMVISISFPAPENLQAISQNDHTIRLSWEHECGFEFGYILERKKLEGGIFNEYARTDANVITYDDTDCDLGTEYVYRVKAYTELNQSAYSNNCEQATEFSAPENLQAISQNDHTIRLSWEHDCSFESGYIIERKESGNDSFSEYAQTASNILTYYDSDFDPGTEYVYRVKAYTELNQSAYSNNCEQATEFSAPENLQAVSINDHTLRLRWEHECGFEFGYILERKKLEGGIFNEYARTDANVITYDDTDCDLGTEYVYRVKAYTELNQSAYSNNCEQATEFPAPENLQAVSIYEHTIRLRWEHDCEFESGYIIERKVTGGDYCEYAQTAANILTYDDSDCYLDTTYVYRVKAYTALNQSEYSLSAAAESCELILVQGGSFEMGSNNGYGEQPVHSVTVSDFYIGKYEVTQEQYEEIMGSNPSYFSGINYPVETVSWYDAVRFCNMLSEKASLQEVYTVSGTTVTMDIGKNGYRLPTEAEWEYAARGGQSSQESTYSGSNSISDVAWYCDNSGSTTDAVGEKQPNELGLYDMSGNVWEWCWDWYGDYVSGNQTDPTGSTTGTRRVLRGGSWFSYAGNCRVAYRGIITPSSSSNIGFRFVRSAR